MTRRGGSSGASSPVLILDCDGVLADTERDGHLPAFNAAFAEFGLSLSWSDDDYHRLLQIGGGKERIAAGVPAAAGDPGLIGRLHARKTELFTERVRAGLLPARPGVPRLVGAVLAAGWTVAVASTSAEASVRAVLANAVGPLAAQCRVFAGDVVPRKKPAPDIYLKVLSDLGLSPRDCVVIEDSAIGVRAARGAGLATLVTTSAFTVGEDFTGAALVLDHLGDPGNALTVLAAPAGVSPATFVTVDDLCLLRGAASAATPRA